MLVVRDERFDARIPQAIHREVRTSAVFIQVMIVSSLEFIMILIW